MTKPTYNTKEAHWYCLHSKAKCEEKVRRQLEQENLESYCPRIRFQKNTIRGQVWFNEALFPCYLFAKFNLIEKRRLINSLSGLSPRHNRREHAVPPTACWRKRTDCHGQHHGKRLKSSGQ